MTKKEDAELAAYLDRMDGDAGVYSGLSGRCGTVINEELLGKYVRVWTVQHGSVLVEGEVIALTDRPTISVRTACDCGRPINVSHIADLPLDVRVWVSRAVAASLPENPGVGTT